jgi:hypothetical protein
MEVVGLQHESSLLWLYFPTWGSTWMIKGDETGRGICHQTLVQFGNNYDQPISAH